MRRSRRSATSRFRRSRRSRRRPTRTPRRRCFFREKAFWTFGRGQRLPDLRRLVRQYERTEDKVFPTGGYFKGGTYGHDVNLPVPSSEQVNPQFQRLPRSKRVARSTRTLNQPAAKRRGLIAFMAVGPGPTFVNMRADRYDLNRAAVSRSFSMRRSMPHAIRIPALVVATAVALPLVSVRAGSQQPHAPAKPTLTSADYAKWETLGTGALSPDGKWVAYDFRRGNGTTELRYRAVDSDEDAGGALGDQPAVHRQQPLAPLHDHAGHRRWARRSRRACRRRWRRWRRRSAGWNGAAPIATRSASSTCARARITTFDDVQSYSLSGDGSHVALRRYPARRAPRRRRHRARPRSGHRADVRQRLRVGVERRRRAARHDDRRRRKHRQRRSAARHADGRDSLARRERRGTTPA